MQVDRVGQSESRIDRHRRPLDAAIGAGKHPRTLRSRQHPHVLLRHHGIREADQAAVLPIVHIDMTGLTAVDDARNDLAVLVLNIDQDRRADRVKIPNVMGDVLIVAGILAGVEIERHERVGVEIVAGTNGAVQVGRRIADHEIDALRGEIDRRVLPHAAAERLDRDHPTWRAAPFPPRCRDACRGRWHPWWPKRRPNSPGWCRSSIRACRSWRHRRGRSRGYHIRHRWCRSGFCRRPRSAPSSRCSRASGSASWTCQTTLPDLASRATSLASSVPK